MSKKTYAVVGSFAMKKGTVKGIHVFGYDPETGSLKHLQDEKAEINAGQNAYDSKNHVLYITHESKDRDGEQGGGGKVLACRLDPEKGAVTWLGEKETLGVQPSYICLTRSGKYMVVPHHGSHDIVTRTVKKPDGSFEAVTECDDGAVTLIRLNDDGTLGEVCDVSVVLPVREGRKLTEIPHLHSCVQSPDGKLLLLCDKGQDVIHGFHLDEENGKMIPAGKTFVEKDVYPRYGLFHPTVPVFYQNCENSVYLHVWKYNSETGELQRIQKVALLEDEEQAKAWTAECTADLVMTKDSRFLYVSVRGLNVVSVLEVKEDGTLKLIQVLGCGGKNPRGLCLAPDEKFLFVMNRDSDLVVPFKRNENGTLEQAGEGVPCGLPGNMNFVSF